MASVKISELNTLLVITSDDFIPIVDSGSGTTYRVTFETLNAWAASSASCLSASYSLSSSYAVSASYSLSSSYAVSATTASYAKTASYYDLTGFAPTNATSAAFAATASSLQGNGLSWETHLQITGSLTMNTGSRILMPRKLDRNVLIEEARASTIFFNTDLGVGSNDYARIYYMESPVDSGRLYFDLGDNIGTLYGTGEVGSGSGECPDIESIALTNAGFLFSTIQSDGYYDTGSLLFIRNNGKVYGRSFEARDFSASIQGEQIGFHGTASHAVFAQTASFFNGSLPATSMPWTVQGLSVNANWAPMHATNADKYKITVQARRIVVHNQAGNTLEISGVNVTNNRTVSGAGGVVGGIFTVGRWYDVFLLYRSDTQATSTVIMQAGPNTSDIDRLSFATDVYPALVGAGQSEWDYGVKVGTIWVTTDGYWQQWFTYGSRKTVTFQDTHPLTPAYDSGYSIYHGFGNVPTDVRVAIKLKTNTTFWNSMGWYKGDQFFEECSLSHTSERDTVAAVWFTRNTDTHVEIGHGYHEKGYWLVARNGRRFDAETFQADLLMIVRIWSD